MKDLFLRGRRNLRRKWSNEFPHGANKTLNRRIVRRRLANELRKNME
jgi:hypothetical protein